MRTLAAVTAAVVGLWSAVSGAAPGDVDTGFGTGGEVAPPIGFLVGTALDRAGRILVAGVPSLGPGPAPPIVARYDASGVPDPTFGEGGVARLASGELGSFVAFAVQPDGPPLLALAQAVPTGNQILGTLHDLRVIRLTTAGAVDSSFGDGGSAAGVPIRATSPRSRNTFWSRPTAASP
jgi:hypothetical protein